jgi:hypothetical protein
MGLRASVVSVYSITSIKSVGQFIAVIMGSDKYVCSPSSVERAVTNKSLFLFFHTLNPVNYIFSQPSDHFTNCSPHRTSESFVPITTGSNLGDGLVYHLNEKCVEDGSEWSTGQPLVP